MLDLKLEIGQAFDAPGRPASGTVEAVFQAVQQQGAQGIVATAGVAVAENQEMGNQWDQLGGFKTVSSA